MPRKPRTKNERRGDAAVPLRLVVAEFFPQPGARVSPDLIGLARRDAEEQVPKKLVEQISLHISEWLRIAFAQFLSTEARALMGIGPRVTKHTITDVWMSPFPSYEDLEVKG